MYGELVLVTLPLALPEETHALVVARGVSKVFNERRKGAMTYGEREAEECGRSGAPPTAEVDRFSGFVVV